MNQFQSAIIKLNAWCNLNCTYCYMFNLGDETYKSVPREIPDDIWDLTCEKIGQHVDARLGVFNVVLHGGEPSLIEASAFERIVSSLRERCGGKVRISVQTNGYVIRRPFLETCDRHGVSIGVSLDGPKEHNDRFRVNHSGSGSHDKVLATVEGILAEGYGHLFAGFLAVANPDIAPDDYWRWFLSLPRQKLNLLWPIEFSHMALPPEPGRYGRWLLRLFQLWLDADDPSVEIPLFFDVVTVSLGGRSHKDQVVNDVMDMLVINTDGRYEYPDYFRPKGSDAVATGKSVRDTSLSELAQDPTFDALFSLGQQLPQDCANCGARRLCGGGFLANRLSSGTSIRQDLRTRSAMCQDHYIFYKGARDLLIESAGWAEVL